MVKMLTNEEFLGRIEEKKCRYKPIDEYKGSKLKIRFLCDKHSEFLARPNDILNGQGCPKCGGTKKLTESEFIKEAAYVHNGFFSYENCGFVNTSEKVVINCPIHGNFVQKASNHLNGQGCLKCKLEGIRHQIRNREKINKPTRGISDSVFKERYYRMHGYKYDLSNTVYVNARTTFHPSCMIHGEFSITPSHLMIGRGCPKCAKNFHYAVDELIGKFKEVHGDKYLYDRVKDATTHENVEIGCKAHGYFMQMVSNHLQGQGCPICKESKMEKEISDLLNANGIEYCREKKFEWLGKQSLDFYLPKYSMAIECQGKQHFESSYTFGGNKMLEHRKILDEKKLNACKKNNISIIYYANYEYKFPYKVITSKEELINLIKKKNARD